MGVYFTDAGTQAGERTNQHCVGGRGDFICMFFEMGDFYADTGSPKKPTNFFVVARLAPLSLFLSLSHKKYPPGHCKAAGHGITDFDVFEFVFVMFVLAVCMCLYTCMCVSVCTYVRVRVGVCVCVVGRGSVAPVFGWPEVPESRTMFPDRTTRTRPISKSKGKQPT